jgi:hypothetical protein
MKVNNGQEIGSVVLSLAVGGMGSVALELDGVASVVVASNGVGSVALAVALAVDGVGLVALAMDGMGSTALAVAACMMRSLSVVATTSNVGGATAGGNCLPFKRSARGLL